MEGTSNRLSILLKSASNLHGTSMCDLEISVIMLVNLLKLKLSQMMEIYCYGLWLLLLVQMPSTYSWTVQKSQLNLTTKRVSLY